MFHRRVTKNDISLQPLNEFSKEIYHKVNRERYKHMQVGEEPDLDIDIDKLVFLDYHEYLERKKELLDGVL